MKRSGPIRPRADKPRPAKAGAPKVGLTLRSAPAKASAGPVESARKAAQRAALNALKRARRAADKAGVTLSEWEGDFLTSVGERVTTYGRAFGDPEKGGPGQALSVNQGVKLKEIARKAKGEAPKRRFGRKPQS